MAFTSEEIHRIEEAAREFLDKRRPPVDVRNKLDHSYRLKGQSVTLFSIRPVWNDRSKTIEEPIAKATFVRRTHSWKIYWQRADLKWHTYDPQPQSLLFEEFLTVVDEDKHGYFWG